MYGRRGGRSSRTTRRKGTFDPSDTTNVKHVKLGVWDLYEEVDPKLAKIPGSSRMESLLSAYDTMPFVWRMIKDVASIRSCWFYLAIYVSVGLISSLVPAVSLWYSGKLLEIVRTAVETRAVDKNLLFRVAAGRFGCSVATRALNLAEHKVVVPLNKAIKKFYSAHTFHAMARLDVPTFSDSLVQRQLEQSLSPNSSSSIAWDTVTMALNLLRAFTQLVSQMSVLARVLHGQPDGYLLLFLCLARTVFQWSPYISGAINGEGVWAATTTNDDYLQMEGLKQTINNPAHRQEIVAGGMWSYLMALYQQSSERAGPDAGPYNETIRLFRQRSFYRIGSFLHDLFMELPQIVFTLRAVQYPISIPVSLASLELITSSSERFGRTLFSFFSTTGNISEKLVGVKKLYEVVEIPNRIVDGHIPFPEDQQALKLGIALEFRNVSFKYPDTETYALRNVSFRIAKGQLCVIVGENGSGKSTVLKLISRIHDAVEGEILIDGHDIKTLKLDDLRRAISVLFQDYTHFPLTIKTNIGLGDPDNAENEEKIIEAAKLGGAEQFISKLPEGFDTYLDRPVRDHYSSLPEGTTTLFGRSVNYKSVRRAGQLESNQSSSLSGGQMQRIALSRTFMRSVVSEAGVGMLLFDEPSASLDPTAEHDLFQRLRALRGNKTMLFSSHRFGNLTRHADLILYIRESVVIEEGTHAELLEKDGEYARIWRLQANQFL
ncbi:P-loop containing nucleoside triphosphate hydrolase protein [Mycena floridula]|nr:P-loop containing nucleoside triphosphate hydrolase protein [Mycena floridula]